MSLCGGRYSEVSSAVLSGCWRFAQPAELMSYYRARRQGESSVDGSAWEGEWEELTARRMEMSQRHQKIQGK